MDLLDWFLHQSVIGSISTHTLLVSVCADYMLGLVQCSMTD